ncbi:MAG TPA: hypothetical protein IAB52_03705 [Candidatus Scatomonas merdavium]|nr:hypothetical protein [Candidatus Scatomonas merdavium]
MEWWQILIIVLAAVAAVIIILYILGKRAKKKQEAQQEQIEASKQTLSMLIIDKKKLRIKDSGLPQMVIDQTPKLMRRTKLPVVKAKVGPKIMTFIAEASVYEIIPVKKEIKATVSGLYIIGAKGIRGSLEQPKSKKKKESAFNRLLRKGRGEI